MEERTITNLQSQTIDGQSPNVGKDLGNLRYAASKKSSHIGGLIYGFKPKSTNPSREGSVMLRTPAIKNQLKTFRQNPMQEKMSSIGPKNRAASFSKPSPPTPPDQPYRPTPKDEARSYLQKIIRETIDRKSLQGYEVDHRIDLDSKVRSNKDSQMTFADELATRVGRQDSTHSLEQSVAQQQNDNKSVFTVANLSQMPTSLISQRCRDLETQLNRE